MKIKDNYIIASDSVWTQIAPNLVQVIQPILTYNDNYWKQGRFKREKVEYTVCMVKFFKKSGEYYIYTGFIPRVLNELKRLNIPYKFRTKIPALSFDEPHIEGITFRDDQDAILTTAIEQGRGVILSATATGKSILIRGLVGAFNQEKILFLVHTSDLVQQMMDDLKNEVDDLGEWSGKTKKKARVMVATIQSFRKIVKEYTYYFDVVFVDECHHVNNTEKSYGTTLSLLAAPAKFGLTATLPTTMKGKRHLEALIGPVIAEFSIIEATKAGVIAKPDIRLIKIPDMPAFSLFDESTVPIPKGKKRDPDYKPTKYTVVYWNGLVTNTTRNMIIVDLAEELKQEGKSTLVSVSSVDHGHELCDISEDYYDWTYGKDFVFIYGNTPKKERNQIKKDFEAKKYKMVIATTVWSEGMNIKSIDCVIIGSGLKGEIGVLQKIGRGLRITETKDTVIIYDFQDTCHKYLRDHFAERYKIYKKYGWL